MRRVLARAVQARCGTRRPRPGTDRDIRSGSYAGCACPRVPKTGEIRQFILATARTMEWAPGSCVGGTGRAWSRKNARDRESALLHHWPERVHDQRCVPVCPGLDAALGCQPLGEGALPDLPVNGLRQIGSGDRRQGFFRFPPAAISVLSASPRQRPARPARDRRNWRAKAASLTPAMDAAEAATQYASVPVSTGRTLPPTRIGSPTSR